MNFNEALQVLRRINVHHGNAPISDAQAQCFYEELARSVSFDEANAAVREFYALHPHGEWMTVGDINLAVRRKRRQSMPSEATITRLMEENQISDPDARCWAARGTGRRKACRRHGRGETPIHAIRPRSRPSSKASSADSRLGRIGRNSLPGHRKNIESKKRHQKKPIGEKNKWQTSPHKQSETPSWTTFPKT